MILACLHDKPFFLIQMRKYKLKTDFKRILADTLTPVSVYLKIRDKYPNSILLESSDYHGNENSFSYICCNPIASIEIKDGRVRESLPDGSTYSDSLKDESEGFGYHPGFRREISNRETAVQVHKQWPVWICVL